MTKVFESLPLVVARLLDDRYIDVSRCVAFIQRQRGISRSSMRRDAIATSPNNETTLFAFPCCFLLAATLLDVCTSVLEILLG